MVAGGARGAHCLLLDRPAWRHLAQYAGYGPASAEGPLRALQAALALRPLKWAPEMRSEEDVALLTRVLQGMDSFRGLPEALCSKLAAGMERVRAPHGTHRPTPPSARPAISGHRCSGPSAAALPAPRASPGFCRLTPPPCPVPWAGATIIEEGDDGECMYILLSGGVEVPSPPPRLFCPVSSVFGTFLTL